MALAAHAMACGGLGLALLVVALAYGIPFHGIPWHSLPHCYMLLECMAACHGAHDVHASWPKRAFQPSRKIGLCHFRF